MMQRILLQVINLARYLSCSIFEGRLAPRTANMWYNRLDFLKKFLPQWLHWTGEQGRAESGRSSSALGGCLLKAFHMSRCMKMGSD